MPAYRHTDALGTMDEITVIEDDQVVEIDAEGHLLASFRFIDADTIAAHPLVIDLLMERLQGESEQLWSMDEVLHSAEVPA